MGLKDNRQHLLEERTLLRRLRQLQLKPTGSQVGGVQAGNGLGEGNFQAIFLEMLRQQSQANQQNQQLIAALMRRMDLEEKRRNEAEEKAAETARLVAEAAARAKTEDPFAAAPSTFCAFCRSYLVFELCSEPIGAE